LEEFGKLFFFQLKASQHELTQFSSDGSLSLTILLSSSFFEDMKN